MDIDPKRLAKLLGVSTQAVQRWMQGKTSPRPGLAVALQMIKDSQGVKSLGTREGEPRHNPNPTGKVRL